MNFETWIIRTYYIRKQRDIVPYIHNTLFKSCDGLNVGYSRLRSYVKYYIYNDVKSVNFDPIIGIEWKLIIVLLFYYSTAIFITKWAIANHRSQFKMNHLEAEKN